MLNVSKLQYHQNLYLFFIFVIFVDDTATKNLYLQDVCDFYIYLSYKKSLFSDTLRKSFYSSKESYVHNEGKI